MQTNQQLKELLVNHIRGTISEKDREALFASLADVQFADQWKLLIRELSSEMRITGPYNEAEWEPVIQEILQKKENVDNAPLHTHHVPLLRLTHKKWFRYAAAAAILIIIATTAIVVSSDRHQNPSKKDGIVAVSDIAPGKDGAVLTLANGQKVLLDSLGNGVVTTQGKTAIVIQNGKLVYDASAKSDEVFYNTMTTPKGRQYQLVLPDGTQVWLNAASSITYPTAFAGSNRNVTITGEAYFEVAKDKSKPFHVKVNDMEVEVLGTHFNINSYAEEPVIRTTLLEGSVRVSNGRKESVILKPSQQAVDALVASSATNKFDRQLSVNSNPDIDQVMAWKNGMFNFDKLSLQEVMRQISRWYDVDVVYEGSIAPKQFGGEIQRDLNLSEVLEGLQAIGVHFKVDGKKVIVMP